MRYFTSLGSGPALTRLAQTAEAAGFEGATLPDHVFYPEVMHSRYPQSTDGSVYWDGDTPWPDPWVTVGAMSAVTTKLRFITSIYILPLRDPFVVAKAVGTAAVLSGGRVILGGALGWMKDEFDVLGQDFSTRGRRAEEMVEVLRLLWQGGMVEHHGRFFDFPRLQMSPAPAAPVPIYLGGRSDPALDRAARVADGYISGVHSLAQFDELAALAQDLQRRRAEHGRSELPFEFFTIVPGPTTVDFYERLAAVGVDGVIMGPPVGPDASTDEHCDALVRFGEEVISRTGPARP
jgi:probable F420-dependent oxidoreductase